jgi:hypothetical protein
MKPGSKIHLNTVAQQILANILSLHTKLMEENLKIPANYFARI